ncbi:hypothetical protein QNH20_05795 [Neobacillus sp. WH10]|nr:hypothetical protein [Neobacillus sp. WH10]WHY78657.1 hypothetical protein QNH20_05795 [Neobacillus sp. WH10]
MSASVAPAGIIRLEWDGDFSEEIEVENTTNTFQISCGFEIKLRSL